MGDAVLAVVATMQERLDALTPSQEPLREFLGTYRRTTLAVGKAVEVVWEDVNDNVTLPQWRLAK